MPEIFVYLDTQAGTVVSRAPDVPTLASKQMTLDAVPRFGEDIAVGDGDTAKVTRVIHNPVRTPTTRVSCEAAHEVVIVAVADYGWKKEN